MSNNEDKTWAAFNKFLRNAPFIEKYLEWLCSGENNEHIIEGLGNDLTIRGHIQDEQLPLLYALGMPKDKKLVRSVGLGANYDRRFKDMCIEVFGIEGDIPPEVLALYKDELDTANRESERTGKHQAAHLDIRRVPPHLPIAGQYTKTKDGSLPIQVWRIRVFLQNASAFTEELWDSRAKGWISHIQNIFDPTNKEEIVQVKRLAEGFALGRLSLESSNIGRPPDSGDFKNNDFPIALEDSLKALKTSGKVLSQADLLYKLSSHPLNKHCQRGKTMSLAQAKKNKKTLMRWLITANLTWRDVIQMYESISVD